jgi:hypothetical protein
MQRLEEAASEIQKHTHLVAVAEHFFDLWP